MTNYLESNVNQYDRYYAKLFDLSLTQLDMTCQQRSALQFQTNLLQMVFHHARFTPKYEQTFFYIFIIINVKGKHTKGHFASDHFGQTS